MTKAGFWLNAAITSLGVVGFMVAAGFFGYKWLAHFNVAERDQKRKQVSVEL